MTAATWTGAGHYDEAERLADSYGSLQQSMQDKLLAHQLDDVASLTAVQQAMANILALAQVHATLALAAATAAQTPLRPGDSLPSYGRRGGTA